MDKELQIRLNFLDEAEEYFDKMESNLLEIAAQAIDAKKVDLVLRAAHSVKGGAAMMGFMPLSKTAHRLEDFLKILRVRYAGESIEVEIETLLLKSVDNLRQIGNLNRQEQDLADTEYAETIQPVFNQLQTYLGELEESDENALMAQNEDVDPALLLFEDGVESIILEFDSAHKTATPDALPVLLGSTAQQLIAFGNMANLTAFCQLCQSVAVLAESTPESEIQTLSKKALKAWKRSHSLVLRGSLEKLPDKLEGYDAPAVSNEDIAKETLDEDIEAIGQSAELEDLDLSEIDPISFGPLAAELEIQPNEFVDSFELDDSIALDAFDELQEEANNSVSTENTEIQELPAIEDFSALQTEVEANGTEVESREDPLADLEDTNFDLLQDAFAQANDVSKGEDYSSFTDQIDKPQITSEMPQTEAPEVASQEAQVQLSEKTQDLLQGISQRLNLDPSILQALIAQKQAEIHPQAATATNNNTSVDKMVRVPASQLQQFNSLFEQLILNRNSINLKLQQLQNTIQLMGQRIGQIESSNTQLKQWYDRASLEGFLNYSPDSNTAPNALSQDRDLFDSLEMDRYSDIHLICQAQIETIVQLQEVAADIQLGLSEINQSVDSLNYTTQSMQGNVTRTQMISFKEVIKRCPRIIRDLNVQYDKQVNLEILGETTLLDRRVAELLNDPLMHLLRNAFDHGIEESEVREKKGKDPNGKITIQASNQGTFTVVTIKDDGAGLSIEKIRDKVVQMGLPQNEVDKIPETELLDFIFEPGFSTATKVTELSGRGVGMDVVKSNLEEIQGSIRVSTEAGQGTTFTIRIPYTLSILRVAVVEQEGMIFAIPANSIQEMFAFNEQPRQEASGIPHLTWMEQDLPVIEMEKGLTYNRTHKKMRLTGSPTIDQDMAIIVKDSDQKAILKINRFWYEQESTIRPIDSMIPLPTGIISSVVFGDGRVIPLVDPSAIISPYFEQLSRQEDDENSRMIIESELNTQNILIVDDSINVRRYLAHTLEKAGYIVEQAKDGQEAVERLMGGLSVNAVICDIEMPRLDGYGFLEEIKGQDKFDELPVVMLTSRSNEKHRKIAMNLGATDYFSKPYNETELLQRLSELTQSQEALALV